MCPSAGVCGFGCLSSCTDYLYPSRCLSTKEAARKTVRFPEGRKEFSKDSVYDQAMDDTQVCIQLIRNASEENPSYPSSFSSLHKKVCSNYGKVASDSSCGGAETGVLLMAIAMYDLMDGGKDFDRSFSSKLKGSQSDESGGKSRYKHPLGFFLDNVKKVEKKVVKETNDGVGRFSIPSDTGSGVAYNWQDGIHGLIKTFLGMSEPGVSCWTLFCGFLVRTCHGSYFCSALRIVRRLPNLRSTSNVFGRTTWHPIRLVKCGRTYCSVCSI